MKIVTLLNKTTLLLVGILTATALLTSCEDEQTYAQQKKAERRAISAFISNGTLQLDNELGDTLLYVPPIKEISEPQFIEQDSTTNLKLNEYVKFGATGVYMQILRNGTGRKIKDDETTRVLVRYTEFNIAGDTIQSRNTSAYAIAMLDEMTVQCQSGTITGTFNQGMMKTLYSSTQVPEGWLIPLRYINLGRYDNPEGTAKVRIIVPHSAGQTNAISSVYPCFYELEYMRSR